MLPPGSGLSGLSAAFQPVVYGYLRAEVPDELELRAWQREIRHFCRERGYALMNVFIDRRVPDDQLPRPGLDGLLDVLKLPGVHGFVVLSTDHLSRDQAVLMTLGLLISSTDAEIIVMDEQGDDVSAWW